MHTEYEKQQYHLGLVLGFGALLWNGTYNALAKGLTPFLSPITLLLLSEALTAFFILITFGIFPLVKELRRMDGKSIAMSVVVGLFGSVAAPLFFFVGLGQTSAINASMLSASDIIVILIGAHFLLREKVKPMQMLGGAIVMLGVIIVNTAGTAIPASVHRGDLFIVAGAMFGGSASILFKKYLSHVMPELAILIRNLGAIVTVSVAAFFLQVSFVEEVSAFPVQKVLLLLSFTFFSRYLNLTFFYESLDRLSATTLSLIQVATPVVGIFFAALILGERIASFQILGCTFIIFGLMLEQVSVRTIDSIRSNMWLSHLPFRKTASKTINGNITLLPKNV